MVLPNRVRYIRSSAEPHLNSSCSDFVTRQVFSKTSGASAFGFGTAEATCKKFLSSPRLWEKWGLNCARLSRGPNSSSVASSRSHAPRPVHRWHRIERCSTFHSSVCDGCRGASHDGCARSIRRVELKLADPSRAGYRGHEWPLFHGAPSSRYVNGGGSGTLRLRSGQGSESVPFRSCWIIGDQNQKRRTRVSDPHGLWLSKRRACRSHSYRGHEWPLFHEQ